MSDSPGAALRDLRERKPLIHQITNYVVMNETANATLAIGALPVMAHAVEEVEEMASAAGALVLNIGTLSRALDRRDAARGQGGERRGRAGRARPGRRRRDDVSHRDGEADPRRGRRRDRARQRGRGRRARRASRRRSAASRRSHAEDGGAEIARAAATQPRRRRLGDGRRRPRLRRNARRSPSRTAIPCSRRSPARAACRPRSPAASPPSVATRRVDAAAFALAAFGVAGEDAARERERPRHVPRALYDALYALTPESLDRVRSIEDGVKLHCIVEDEEAARVAADGARPSSSCGSRACSTLELVERGRPVAERRARGGDHLRRQRRRRGGARARTPTACTSAATTRARSARAPPGCCSASRRRASTRRSRRRSRARTTSAPARCGRRRRSRTPAAPIGLDGLAAICEAVARARRRDRRHRRVERARLHRSAGATGVAVVRASADAARRARSRRCAAL